MTMKKRKTKRDGLYLRGDIWYFRRMIKGDRVAVSTGCKDRRQAERRKTELDLEMNNETFGWKVEPIQDAPTIAAYLQTTAAIYDSHDEGERSRRLTELAKAFLIGEWTASPSPNVRPTCRDARRLVWRRTACALGTSCFGRSGFAPSKKRIAAENPWTRSRACAPSRGSGFSL